MSKLNSKLYNAATDQSGKEIQVRLGQPWSHVFDF